MRWMACVGLAAAVGCCGCASSERVEPIAFAVMQNDPAQPANTAGGATMVVERELHAAPTAKKISVPTLIRIKGVRTQPTRGMVDFRVLSAPIPSGWTDAARTLAVPKGNEAEWEPSESVDGQLVNTTPSWEVTGSGYALLWGWWPAALTERVSAGTDGSTMLVVTLKADEQNAVDYIILIEGSQSARVQQRNVPNAPVYALPAGQYIKAEERNGNVTITGAQPLSGNSALTDLVKIVERQRTQIVEW